MRRVDDHFPEMETLFTAPIATHGEVFDDIKGYGFRQGTDFAFSLLTKADKLSFIKNFTMGIPYKREHYPISPFGWAHLILQLETSQEREAFYREYGYDLLICIVVSWPYYDFFNAAVVELVDFLSVEQFGNFVLRLSFLVARSIRPYDQSAGDMFLFFWQTSSEDLRAQFIRRHLNGNDLPTFLNNLSREALANVQPRCFAAVVRDMERMDVLASFLLSVKGLTLCISLIEKQCFKCLKFFRSHVSVAQLAIKLDSVMKKTAVSVFELYHWMHGDY